jgi:inorganic pyrophosphatase/exopolyphosphatase
MPSSGDGLFPGWVNSRQEKLRDCSKADRIVFVVGNASADMDSVACALSYGYFLQQTSGTGVCVVPVVQLADLRDLLLRTEVAWLLEQSCVSLSDLVSVVQMEAFIAGGLGNNNATVVLVDHNNPGEVDWAHLVRGVVDHHVDDRVVVHQEGVRISPRVVEVCGSCASLCARLMGSFLQEGACPPVVRRLMQAAILLDTVNFSPRFGKTTSTDRTAMLLLQCSDSENKELFGVMQAKRFDTSSLSSAQLLKKDTKQGLVHVGPPNGKTSISYSIPGVCMALQAWVEREGGLEALAGQLVEYRTRVEADVLLVNLKHETKEGEWVSETCFVCEKGYLARLVAYIQAPVHQEQMWSLGGEQLWAIMGPGGDQELALAAYRQLEPATRKQVLPALRVLLATEYSSFK